MCRDKAQSEKLTNGTWAVGCVCWVQMKNLSLVLPPPLHRGDLRQAAQSLFLVLQRRVIICLGRHQQNSKGANTLERDVNIETLFPPVCCTFF